MMGSHRFALGDSVFDQLCTLDFIKADGAKPAGFKKPGPHRFGIVIRHDFGPVFKLPGRQRKAVNRACRPVKPKDCGVHNANPAQCQIQRAGRKAIAPANFHKGVGAFKGRNQIDTLTDRSTRIIFDGDFARGGVQNATEKEACNHRHDRGKSPNRIGKFPKSAENRKNNCSRICHLFHPDSARSATGPPFKAPHEPFSATLRVLIDQNLNPPREIVANLDTMFLKPDKCLVFP